MLTRVTSVALALWALAAYGASLEPQVCGRWLWHGIDAQDIVTIERDHAYTEERFGVQGHHIRKGTWRMDGDKFHVTWPNGDEEVYAILHSTADTLVLRSPHETAKFS